MKKKQLANSYIKKLKKPIIIKKTKTKGGLGGGGGQTCYIFIFYLLINIITYLLIIYLGKIMFICRKCMRLTTHPPIFLYIYIK